MTFISLLIVCELSGFIIFILAFIIFVLFAFLGLRIFNKLIKFINFKIVVLSSIIALSSPFLRSEEHTSELQSRPHLVCCLLLEKKNILPLSNFSNSTKSPHINSSFFFMQLNEISTKQIISSFTLVIMYF